MPALRPAAVRSFAVVAITVCQACSTATQHSVFPPSVVADSISGFVQDPASIETVRSRGIRYDEATGNFSAVVAVSVRDRVRGATYDSRGGLAVRRPDRVRMQLVAAGGITAVDLLVRAPDVWLRLAGGGWSRTLLDAPAQGRFSPGMLARAFLGFVWARASAVRIVGALAVVRTDGGGRRTEITLETRDGTTREVRWWAAGRERMRVRFADFDAARGTPRFARTILFWQAEPAVTGTVRVEQHAMTPELPVSTFAEPIEGYVEAASGSP